MKIKNQDLFITNDLIVRFLNENKDETKSFWRLKNRTLKSFTKWAENFNDEVQDAQNEHCVTGDKGEIIYKDGQRCYTPKGDKGLRDALKALREKNSEIEVTVIQWGHLSESEQKWFNLNDEETVRIMNLFIEGAPVPILADEKD